MISVSCESYSVALSSSQFCVFLSQKLGAMISTDPSILEACGGFIPDPGDLRTLLLHQQAKGLICVKGKLV